MAQENYLSHGDTSPTNDKIDLRTNDNLNSVNETKRRIRTSMIPEREIRSLSSVKRTVFNEDMTIQRGHRRSKPTLGLLGQMHQATRDEARELLTRLPRSRSGPILPDDLPEFKGRLQKIEITY